MKIHKLKLDIKYFEDEKSGKKNFVIRKNDRDYQVGDILELKAYVGQGSAEEEGLDVGYAWTEHLFEEGHDIWENCEGELADTFKVKVKEVIKTEQLNQRDWDDETLESMWNINWPNVMEVLVEYFDTEQMPVDYVLMEVEVVK
ncbi:DUF3850 domain-containing protein [Lactococcus formosensis subsp. bovis]|uniref:DUF3850 domain-containing protein n=1 Tax=Lactococcus formosensis TaxID=1281486 RepID=UPI001BD07484|nr:DUF3850 domain-containing protein [Lactococcus formosensis]